MSNKRQERLHCVKGRYGLNWRRLRESTKMTVRELAKEVMMSYSSISKIENELAYPTIEQINIYQNHFKVSIDYLVGLTSNSSIELSEISEYTGLSQQAIEKLHSYVERANLQKSSYDKENDVLIDNTSQTDYITELYNEIICDNLFEQFLEALFELKRETQLLADIIEGIDDVEAIVEGSLRGLIIKAQLLDLDLTSKINKFKYNYDVRNNETYIKCLREITENVKNRMGFAQNITDEEMNVAISHINGKSPRNEINPVARSNTMSMLTLVDVSEEKELF